MRIHTGMEPYLCPQCENSFSREGHLKSHIKSHSGEKQFFSLQDVTRISLLPIFWKIIYENTHRTKTLCLLLLWQIFFRPWNLKSHSSKVFYNSSNLNLHRKITQEINPILLHWPRIRNVETLAAVNISTWIIKIQRYVWLNRCRGRFSKNWILGRGTIGVNNIFVNLELGWKPTSEYFLESRFKVKINIWSGITRMDIPI